MYKMGEVCEKTGLTEKAIRIYMEQKLVEPKVEEGVHRKSYYFSEKDIERLKDVSALRNAGFSIAEIKQMIENPVNIAALVEEREAILAAEIKQKTAVQEALQHLTIQEHSDVAKLADAVEPRSTYAKETPKKKMSRKKKWILSLGLVIGVLFWLTATGGEIAAMVPVIAFCFLFGIVSLVSAIRYFLHSKKAEKVQFRTKGKVTAIVMNENVEAYIGKRERSNWKELLAYLMFGLFGEGIWENLRPDCWYPVVSYQTEEGQQYLATFRYGGFKKDWTVGEELEVAWEAGKERLIYDTKGKRLRKNACRYLVVGMILLGIFGFGAASLFTGNTSMLNTKNVQKIWDEHLELVTGADKITIFCQDHLYELDEEEREVLMAQLKGLTIEEGKRHVGIVRGDTIRFYKGDEEIERYTIGDMFYITTGQSMRYRVVPIAVELDGTPIEDTTYITGFLLRFTEKILLKDARIEMLERLATMEDVEELKQLLAEEYFYRGAVDLGNGYRFIMSEFGFQNYWDNAEDTLEYGSLRIRFNEGVMEAGLEISYQTKDGNIETYTKQW